MIPHMIPQILQGVCKHMATSTDIYLCTCSLRIDNKVEFNLT